MHGLGASSAYAAHSTVRGPDAADRHPRRSPPAALNGGIINSYGIGPNRRDDGVAVTLVVAHPAAEIEYLAIRRKGPSWGMTGRLRPQQRMAVHRSQTGRSKRGTPTAA